jgi:hypothetical protein
VSFFCEASIDALRWKKSSGVPFKIELQVAQIRRAAKERNLTKADWLMRFFRTNRSYGRGPGVGRGRGVGGSLGVGVTLGVEVGVAVAVATGVVVGV